MKVERVTELWLRSVRTEKAQEDYWDGSRPGFYVRVYNSGRRSFLFSYYSPILRKKRSLVLGAHGQIGLSEAVARWKVASGQVAEGVDPQGIGSEAAIGAGEIAVWELIPKDRQEVALGIFGKSPVLAKSFGELSLFYLLEHAWPEKRRTRDDEEMLRRVLLPAWGSQPADSVGRREVSNLVTLIAGRGTRRTAEHVRLLVSRIYNFGIETGRVEHNPAHLLRVRGGRAKPRTRWAQDEELVTLWRGLEAASSGLRGVTRMQIVTIQRPGEVCAMEWSEIGPHGWRLPGTKEIPIGGRMVEVGTKNKLDHLVPLTPLALKILEAQKGKDPRFVFPSPKRPGQPLWETAQTLKCWVSKLELTSLARHDLRRSGVVGLQRLGVSDEVIDRVVNHVQAGVRRHYHLFDHQEAKQAALMLWDSHLSRLFEAE